MDEVISVSVPGYKDQVFHSLHQLQQRGVNCDVTLQACDGTANIHSIILAANSEKHIYSKISQTNENHQVDCTKYRIHVIKAVVIFLYSGELVIEKSFYNDLVQLCKDLYLSSACDSFNHQYQITKVHPSTYDKDGVKEKTVFERELYIHSNNSNSSYESTSTIPLGNDDLPATPMKTVSRGDSLYLKVTDLKNDQGTSSDDNNMETSSVEYGCTNDSRPSSSSLGENLINQIENIVMQCVDNEKKEKKGERATKRPSRSLSSDTKEKPSRKKKKTSLNKKRKVTKVIKSNKRQRNIDNDEDAKDHQDCDMTDDTTSLKPKKQWKCTKCNLIFQSFSERAEHMRKLHKPYPCELCDWVGVQPHLYASHMYGQHKVVIYSERYPLVQCDFQGCTYKCLNINMKDHMRCHKYKKEKLVCHVCGMEFTSEGGLRAHSSYHKEEEMKFKCKECDKVFGWKHELSKHLTAEHKTHNLCHLCPFKSKNKTSLIVHLHNKHAEPIPEKMKTQGFPMASASFCDPCSEADKSLTATKYCSDCEERLCTDCAESHCRFKAFKSHHVIDLSSIGSNILMSAKKTAMSIQK
ncbi:KRAB [Mytilus edulis]|uniref:KRAB n=1 Tax=Mytilus edulis TaxID=6550 RepID=A0A8S3SB62_MYTED|nr:KRAB [Mytilus edulis]